METGIFYIASGKPYYEQAVASAESAKAVMPDVPIAIATDHDGDATVFDRVISVPDMHGSLEDKPENMTETPFDRTLFVDTDTYFVRPVPELWDLLDQYAIAATHTSHRRYDHTAPAHVPEYNTGVLLYRTDDTTLDLLSDWNETFGTLDESARSASGGVNDQASFRHVLFQHSAVEDTLNFLTLPPEYNVLTNDPGFLRGPAKILHGQHADADIESVGDELNHHTETPGQDKRVHYQRRWPGTGVAVRADCPDSSSLRSVAWYRLRRDGPASAARYLLARSVPEGPIKQSLRYIDQCI